MSGKTEMEMVVRRQGWRSIGILSVSYSIAGEGRRSRRGVVRVDQVSSETAYETRWATLGGQSSDVLLFLRRYDFISFFAVGQSKKFDGP
jgi:hypothetical protein